MLLVVNKQNGRLTVQTIKDPVKDSDMYVPSTSTENQLAKEENKECQSNNSKQLELKPKIEILDNDLIKADPEASSSKRKNDFSASKRCYVVLARLSQYVLDKYFKKQKQALRADGRYKYKANECHICKKRFSGEHNLAAHVRNIHAVIHECNVCNLTFPRKVELNRHATTHSEAKRPAECPICNKCFEQKYHVDRHMRNVHNGMRPHECQTCKKRFKENYQLVKHVRSVHDGVKTYECNTCKNRFKEKQHLTRHVWNVHIGIKTHECHVCKKLFKERQHLKKHVKTHSRASNC